MKAPYLALESMTSCEPIGYHVTFEILELPFDLGSRSRYRRHTELLSISEYTDKWIELISCLLKFLS
jgi:hypothetical protein